MKIKRSEGATRPSPLRDRLALILTAAISVGLCFGLFYVIHILTGHFPSLKTIGALVLLNVYWATVVSIAARKGWQKPNWAVWANVIGASLFLARYAFPHSLVAMPFVKDLGIWLTVAAFLPRILTGARRKQETVPVAERVGSAL